MASDFHFTIPTPDKQVLSVDGPMRWDGLLAQAMVLFFRPYPLPKQVLRAKRMLLDELLHQRFGLLNCLPHSRYSEFVSLGLTRQEYSAGRVQLNEVVLNVHSELRVWVHHRVNPSRANNSGFLYLKTRVYPSNLSADCFKSLSSLIIFNVLLFPVIDFRLHQLRLATSQCCLTANIDQTPDAANNTDHTEQREDYR